METLEDKPFLLAYGDKVASDKEDPAAMVSVAAAKKKTPASRIPTEKKREQLDQGVALGVALGLPKKYIKLKVSSESQGFSPAQITDKVSFQSKGISPT
jgi:hypothetical protein